MQTCKGFLSEFDLRIINIHQPHGSREGGWVLMVEEESGTPGEWLVEAKSIWDFSTDAPLLSPYYV